MAEVKEYELRLKDNITKDYIASLSESVVHSVPSNDKLMIVNLTDLQYQRLLDRDLVDGIMSTEEHDARIENADVRSVSYYRHDPHAYSDWPDVDFNAQGNWGLIRHTNDTNNTSFDQQITTDYTYNYTGIGVDLIVLAADTFYIGEQDSELRNSNGESKVKQFQWNTLPGLESLPDIDYNDIDGLPSNVKHAEAVTKIAAGNTYGWAPGVNIYIVPREKFLPTFWHECARVFHNEKKAGNITGVPSDRPTVLLSAYTYSKQFNERFMYSVKFRGQEETRRYGNNDISSINSDKALPGYGIKRIFVSPGIDSNVYARADDVTSAGIINVVAAGNSNSKQCLPGNIDYNNYYKRYDSRGGIQEVSSTEYYYNRPQPTAGANGLTSPTISCAALASHFGFNTTIHGTSELLAEFSDKGNRIDCCAAGNNIPLKLAGTLDETDIENGDRENFLANGTSFASPQIAGMACLVLQKYPTTTPMQMRKYFRDHAISSEKLYDTGLAPLSNTNHFGDSVYFDSTHGLQGYSGNIAYLDPDLTFDPTTISDTSIANAEVTAEGRLNFTIDEINTKLGSL